MSQVTTSMVGMAVRVVQAILAVAAPSAGVCTRAELRRAGVPEGSVGHQVRAGLLRRVGGGVFQAPALITGETPYYRAVRAHPRGAVARLSAGWLGGAAVPPVDPIDPADPRFPVEVLVPAGASVRSVIEGVSVHCTTRWDPADLVEVRPGLIATGPARTIVDLAGTGIGDHRLRHLVQTEVAARRVSLVEVAACLDRVGARGVAGAGRLRHLLHSLGDGDPVPQSELERRAAPLLGPRFRPQYRPPWYDGRRGIADFTHPETRIIVEVDGRRWHIVDQAVAEDRRRDRAATAEGWIVLRLTWDDVVNRPATTAAEITSVVAARERDAA